MKTFLTVVVLAVFSLCSGAAALAQQGVMWRGGGGWGSGMPYSQMFNPQTVETIRGVVVLVEKIAPMRGMAYGVFHTAFGVAWLAGSALMGVLYDHARPALIAFAVAAPLLSIPLLAAAGRSAEGERSRNTRNDE